MMSAYELGIKAYDEGWFMFNNPYSEGSLNHNEWVAGWCYGSYINMMHKIGL